METDPEAKFIPKSALQSERGSARFFSSSTIIGSALIMDMDVEESGGKIKQSYNHITESNHCN